MKRKVVSLILTMLVGVNFSFAEKVPFKQKGFEINSETKEISAHNHHEGDSPLWELDFENAHHQSSQNLPALSTKLNLPDDVELADVEISPKSWQDLPEEVANQAVRGTMKDWRFKLNVDQPPFFELNFYPYRERENKIELLEEFEVTLYKKENDNNRETSSDSWPAKKGGNYPESSMLSSGDWFKIGVTETGMYSLDEDFLSSLGMNTGEIDPSDIRVFGYGGEILPEEVGERDFYDMEEIPVHVTGGSFSGGDRVVFFAEGPVTWHYNHSEERFEHEIHLYSDTISYFITADHGTSSSPEVETFDDASADITVDSYDSRTYYEEHLPNEIKTGVKSGRDWFGKTFDRETTYEFDFNLPNLLQGSSVKGEFRAAARSRDHSSFTLHYGSQQLGALAINPRSSRSDGNYYDTDRQSFEFNPGRESFSLEVNYQKPRGSSKGFMGHILLNGRSSLSYDGGPLFFRDSEVVVDNADIAEFSIGGAPSSLQVWDITDINGITSHEVESSGGDAHFTAGVSEIREFVAFEPDEVTQNPHDLGQVDNQDLHQKSVANYLMVVHPKFEEAAERLKEYHEEKHGYSVTIVNPQNIYNEFSSGIQDPSAIRDFNRHLYKKANETGEDFKYLLLFGDGSYDPKDRIDDNQNYMVTYQSESTKNRGTTFVTDDYFGFLNKGEGKTNSQESFAHHTLNLAIGRMPVRTKDEAHEVVDKIKGYHDPENYGDWQSQMAFMADDGDRGLHINQSEELAEIVKNQYPEFDQKKIYLDAYDLQGTPSGPRYPGAKEDLTRAINQGSLFINYMGHGGARGLTDERVFRREHVHDWKNEDKLTIFVTGTCGLSRFDDPEERSGGEMMLLEPDAGAVGMLTTTRIVYAFQNFNFVSDLFQEKLLENANGADYSLGEALKAAKNTYGSGFTPNNVKFLLLGDPALRPAIPEQNVETATINQKDPEVHEDTMSALEHVSINGYVTDHNGSVLRNFDGELTATVFDKPLELETQGHKQPPSDYQEFSSAIFRGKATVEEGEFELEFVVPEDINYQIDRGRIRYYAHSENTNALGVDNRFYVGGTSDEELDDSKVSPPEVELFMNDTTFEDGDYVNESPLLLAHVEDQLGINMTGAGVGHNIRATLNDEEEFILNNYYQTKPNSYQEGEIRYPFSELEDGEHDLSLTVWNVANKSATAEISFIVGSSEEILLQEITNRPNPFRESTEFVIQHNKQGEDLDISVQIFDMQGNKVKRLNSKVNNAPHAIEGDPEWKVESDAGASIQPGVFIYRVIVEDSEGRVATESGKAIFSP